ncbi:hypothetical protein NLX71_24225 [Paenibacillus sp. MZ04-78.2]|uniref:hypothetical protein n=1 Tax=Paenibacillus sp. MZ04-78.2 TaxID=2962034 RepID=UPI0020B6FA69|nr:hypothetical protein [Paenibacillus sp. MZ04-78.2]MCP3776368.1 hypothetical protein [Paenibacillus sp. MZ04-78.2]
MGHMDEQWLELIGKQEQEERQKALKAALAAENVSRAIQAGELVLGVETITFSRTEVIPGQVFMFVPDSFEPMPEDYAKIKYPADRRPKLIYTDPTLEINLTVNPTANRMVNDEMDTFVKDLSFMIRRMQPNAKWIGEGVREVGGHKMGFYEFSVPVLDGVMYNGIFFIELDGKGVFFGLNCMEKYTEQWRPIAHGIMDALQINPKREGEE